MPRGQGFICLWRGFDDRRFPLQITIDRAQQRLRAFPERVYRFGNIAL